jgi:NSS family neurotransmitter:Na+ symporter
MSNEVSGTPSVAKVVNAVKRDGFTTRMGMLLATLGSAVGLGNIWKFPYLTGANGGALFVLIYLVAVLLIGIPVMVAELGIGRSAQANAVNAMTKVSPNRFPWWIIGAMGIFGSFIIMAYYSEVAGWVLAYIPKIIATPSLSTNPTIAKDAFGALVTNPIQSIIWQWVDLAIITAIIIFGVSKGIESAAKKVIPVLLGLLVIVAIRSLTLPGAAAGLKFLFMPDFTKVTGSTILAAMGLAFFKLSIGMGVMITYGSYFRKEQDIPATAVRVALSDVGIALLAGVAIFPAVFAYGFEPAAGVSLLFNTIPAVFASMPGGHIFCVIFFVLTFLASIGAQLSLVEAVIAFITERFHISRKVGTAITIGMMLVAGAPAALSNSSMANVTIFGKTFFDLFDYMSSNILLPLGGLLICIFIGWVWGYKNYQAAIGTENNKNEKVVKTLFFLTRYVAPVLILVVFLSGFGLIK